MEFIDESWSAASSRLGWVERIRPARQTNSGKEPRITMYHGHTAPVNCQDNWGGWSISRQGPSPQVSF